MKISRKHSVTLLKLNTHDTSSGRYYPSTCFAKLPTTVLGLIDKSGIDAAGNVDLFKVGFTVTNIRIEHDELLGDIDFLNSSQGDIARTAVASGYEYRAVSTGVVDLLNRVSNAELIAVYLAKD